MPKLSVYVNGEVCALYRVRRANSEYIGRSRSLSSADIRPALPVGVLQPQVPFAVWMQRRGWPLHPAQVLQWHPASQEQRVQMASLVLWVPKVARAFRPLAALQQRAGLEGPVQQAGLSSAQLLCRRASMQRKKPRFSCRTPISAARDGG
jgi:hypothetical protein